MQWTRQPRRGAGHSAAVLAEILLRSPWNAAAICSLRFTFISFSWTKVVTCPFCPVVPVVPFLLPFPPPFFWCFVHPSTACPCLFPGSQKLQRGGKLSAVSQTVVITLQQIMSTSASFLISAVISVMSPSKSFIFIIKKTFPGHPLQTNVFNSENKSTDRHHHRNCALQPAKSRQITRSIIAYQCLFFKFKLNVSRDILHLYVSCSFLHLLYLLPGTFFNTNYYAIMCISKYT